MTIGGIISNLSQYLQQHEHILTVNWSSIDSKNPKEVFISPFFQSQVTKARLHKGTEVHSRISILFNLALWSICGGWPS